MVALKIVRREWVLGLSVFTCIAFQCFDEALMQGLDQPARLALVLAWLFSVMLGSSMSVVRHAEHLAKSLGEPVGTLVLTLSVTAIEVVSITAIMLHGENNPSLARDTLFAVTMIVLNGMVGLSLLLGGLRHREQQYNLQGANAYLGVIIPLAILGLVMPDFTVTTPGPTFSRSQEAYLAVISVGLYIAFLTMQTFRHRGFFTFGVEGADGVELESDSRSTVIHGILLLAYMAPVVFLAEKLAVPVDYVIETLRAPAALGGLLIAILVATPEAIGAVRAAASNQLQRSINIFLGSVLSTIGLTVPAIIVVSNVTAHPIQLGLEHTDLVLLVLTLGLCVVTFSSGKTHVLQGIVHLILFATYLAFIFQG